MQPGTGTNNIQLGNGGGFGMNPMLNMTSPLNAAGTNPHGFGMQGAAVPMAGGGFSGGPPPPAQGFSGPGGGALALQKTGLPCEYWRAGMCNRGASCFYNHDPAEFGVFKPKPIAPPAAPGPPPLGTERMLGSTGIGVRNPQMVGSFVAPSYIPGLDDQGRANSKAAALASSLPGALPAGFSLQEQSGFRPTPAAVIVAQNTDGVVFVGSDRYLARVKSWDQLRNIGIVHCPLIHEKLNSDVIISGPGLADIGTNQLAPGQLISFSLMINTEKRPEARDVRPVDEHLIGPCGKKTEAEEEKDEVDARLDEQISKDVENLAELVDTDMWEAAPLAPIEELEDEKRREKRSRERADTDKKAALAKAKEKAEREQREAERREAMGSSEKRRDDREDRKDGRDHDRKDDREGRSRGEPREDRRDVRAEGRRDDRDRRDHDREDPIHRRRDDGRDGGRREETRDRRDDRARGVDDRARGEDPRARGEDRPRGEARPRGDEGGRARGGGRDVRPADDRRDERYDRRDERGGRDERRDDLPRRTDRRDDRRDERYEDRGRSEQYRRGDPPREYRR